jgi:hypothetical protein
VSKWLVVLGFDEEDDAYALVNSAKSGGVEIGIGAGWHRVHPTVELGPYIIEDGDES